MKALTAKPNPALRSWLREHRLLLWAVVFSPCHLFWVLPLLGAILAPTPLDRLFAAVRFPLEVVLAVTLSVHSLVVIARWLLRPARPHGVSQTEGVPSDTARSTA